MATALARISLAALFAFACLGGSAHAASWTTYGFDLERTGFNPKEHFLGTVNAGRLREVWSAKLGGVSNTQPIVVEKVELDDGRTLDLVLAGSESGRLIAFDAATGARVWGRRLGSRVTVCKSTFPEGRFGVTATPTVDRKRKTVYVVDGKAQAYALDLRTGKTKKGWPATVTKRSRQEHVWGALAFSRGVLYAGTASHCDEVTFHGRVVGIDRRGEKVAEWFPAGTKRGRGGGVWGWGGVAIDRRDGNLYTATGNGQVVSETVGYSERIVRLSPSLRVVSSHLPNVPKHADNDFGAAAILYRAKGCPRQAAVVHKSGYLLLYDRKSIKQGPRQTLALANPDESASLGTYAYSPKTRMLYVATRSASPDGRYRGGIVALAVGADCRLRLAWQQSPSPTPELPSTPAVANGVVYLASGREVFGYDAASGRPLWRSGTAMAGVVYAAPTVVNGRVFAVSWDRKLHAFAPAP